MFKNSLNGKVMIIAILLVLFISLPSSFAGDSSAINVDDGSSLILDDSNDLSSVDSQILGSNGGADLDSDLDSSLDSIVGEYNQEDNSFENAVDSENGIRNNENVKTSNLDKNQLSEGDGWTIEETGESYSSLSEAVSAAESGNTIIGTAILGEYLNNITINKDLTIKALNLGDVSLKTYGQSAFYLEREYNLNLINLRFENYNPSSNVRGGVVYNNGNLTLDNCVMANINANSGYNYGGLIYSNDKSILTIANSLIENISASFGPIYASGCNVYLVNNTFRNTGGSSSAGAVYMWGSKAVIEACNFLDSSTSQVLIYATSSSLDLIGSTFRNITSSDEATALYTWGSANATIVNCIFDSCKDTSSSNDAAGAIFSDGNYINISHCTFRNCQQTGIFSSNNTFRVFAGAVLADVGDVNHCIFLNNSIYSGSSEKTTLYAVYYSDLYLGSGNADYNYWSSNAGPTENMTNYFNSIDNWYILTMDLDGDVTVNQNKEIVFNLNKVNQSDVIIEGDNLPNINLTVKTTLSGEDYDLNIVDGTGTVNYVCGEVGDETLSVENVEDQFEFSVLADDLASIYVSSTGDDSNPGSDARPYRTIAFALSQVTDTRNVIFIKSGTYKENGLVVSKSVSILAQGDVIIDAEGNGRIFTVNEGIDFALKDLNLVNGYVSSDGGAILSLGNLTLNNVTINGSTANNGGALAINGSFYIFDSEFSNNHALSDGGAIFIYGKDSEDLGPNPINTIKNTDFKANLANNGGAIASYGAIIINASQFNTNIANANGGAVFADNSHDLKIVMDSSTLRENSASYGGAIYLINSNSNISLINDVFIENSASSFGGALLLKNVYAFLSGNNMGGNEAGDGNAIYLDNSFLNGVLTFIDAQVINANIGQTLILNATVTDDMGNEISGGTVSFNVGGESLSSKDLVNGIAVLSYTIEDLSGSDLIVTGNYSGFADNCTINNGYIHTSASYWFIEGGNSYEYLADALSNARSGDVIYGLPGVYANPMLTINKDITIKSLNKGDVILMGMSAKVFNITKGVTVNLINLTLSNGASNGLGGLIEAKGILNIENCTLKDTQVIGSYAQGGAIFLWDESQLNILNCEFRNLSASTAGGAIYVYTATSSLNVINSTFDNLSSNGNGSAIYSRSPIVINGSNFTNINGPFYIGTIANNYAAVYVANDLTIDNSRFINITGPRSSVIRLDNPYSTLTITHTVFDNNMGLNTTVWSVGMYNYINYCIFANNIGINGNYWDIIANGNYLVESNFNYNYWESNNGPYYNFNNESGTAIADKWVVLELSTDEEMLLAGSTNTIYANFNRYTDGVNFYQLSEGMPDYTFDLTAKSEGGDAGTIDDTLIIVNGEGTATYIAPNENTHIKINVSPGDEFLEFDVMKTDSLIYVSNRGSDITGEGSYQRPYATIAYALTRVNDLRNIIYIENGNYSEHDLNISQSVVIQGQSADKAIIDAKRQANIFNIVGDSNINVSINTLTLTNGNSDYGGAINLQSGNLSLYNTFISSSSANYGGAVFVNGDASIFNNTFIDIGSESNGVIYLNSSNLNLSENIMVNVPENAIYVNGGSLNVLIKYLNNSTVEVPRSTTVLLNATVTDDMGNAINGGKLEFRVNGGLVGIADVVNGIASVEYPVPYSEAIYPISGSYSNQNAESVIRNGAIRSIKLAWFIGDVGFETLEQAVKAAKDGDVIIGVPGTYKVGHIVFDKDLTVKANQSGTVVLHMVERYFADVPAKSLNLEGLIVENANGYQGYFIYNSHGIVDIDNCTFRNSALSTTFGVLYNVYGIMNVNNSNFLNLTLTDSSSSEWGGAICAHYSEVNVSNSRFEDTHAGSYGGAISLYDFSIAKVVNSSFINSSSSFRGGGIYVGGESNLTVINSTFINNTASSYGGAICSERANIYVFQSVFMDNVGVSRGGAIYLARNATINYNIFINNKVNNANVGHDVYFYWYNETYPDEYVDIDYNYWGTNDGPNSTKISETLSTLKWDILEVSINSTNVLLGPDYTINMELLRYQYGDNIYLLNEKMPRFDLELTSVIGELGSEKATIEDGKANVTYHPIAVGNETIYFIPSDQVLNFSVDFGSDYYLSPNVTDLTIDFGDSYDIVVSTLDNYRAITADLNGQKIIITYKTDKGTYSLESKEIQDSKITFNLNELSELEAGDNAIITFALEDDSYDLMAGSVLVAVNKLVTSLNTDGDEINVSVGLGSIDIRLFNGANPLENKLIKVFISSANANFAYDVLTDSNGIAKVDLADIPFGEYDVDMVFEGDKNYMESSGSAHLIVSKIDTVLNADDVNASKGNGTLNINLTANDELIINGNYDIDIQVVSLFNNESSGLVENKTVKNITVRTNNGVASLDLSDLDIGDYIAIIRFDGNDQYNPSEISSNINIYQLNMEILANDVTITKGSGTLEITLLANQLPLSRKIINVEIGDYSVSKLTDNNGKVSVDLSSLIPGEYVAIINFEGDKDYPAVFTNCNILVMDDGSDDNGTNITPDDDNDTKPGVRKASQIIYSDMVTTAIDVEVDGKMGNYFVVYLKDLFGKPIANKRIQIGLCDRIYNITTAADGSAKLQINLKYSGIYTFAVSFVGDDEYDGDFAVSKITVNAQKPKLVSANKSYKASAKTKTLTATFKTSRNKPIKGKKITFKVNGKKYTATTNAKGVATVKVNLSKKGTYSFTASFAGDKTYAKSSVTKKITIK